MTISVTLDYNFRATDDGDNAENISATARHVIKDLEKWTDGVGASEADIVVSDRRSLAASATEDIDLTASTIPDAYGNNPTFALVKLFILRNRNTTAGDDLEVGGVTNPWLGGLLKASGDVIRVPAGGVLMWSTPNGRAVTAGTGDIITITEVGTANEVFFDIMIAGDDT